MKPGDQTKLTREVPATAIPAGSPLILPKDTEVTLTQSLGEVTRWRGRSA